MKKPKILFLLSGGTISQKKDPHTGALIPMKNPKDILHFIPELQDKYLIQTKLIENLDSSNISPKHWMKFATTIIDNYEQFDGFVITHGTDTMSYSASALSFALTNLGKPVVFTGAQLPLRALGTDARNNLINACRVASMDIGEVVVVFGDKILRGNRSSKQSESTFDAFWSPVYPDLGKIKIEIELFNSHKKKNVTRIPSLHAAFNTNVIAITITPGLQSKHLESLIESNMHGVVLAGFGAGNVPTQGDSLIPAIKKFVDRNIPIIISSQCAAGVARTHLYETGLMAQKAGAISSEDMTLEATTTKLMWALTQANTISTLNKIMHKNIAGEITQL